MRSFISEGVEYAMCAAQGDVQFGYKCCDATGTVRCLLLQMLNRVNMPVPCLTPEVLEAPFTVGRENNSRKALLHDGYSHIFCRHLSFTSSQCSLLYGAKKFLTNRASP